MIIKNKDDGLFEQSCADLLSYLGQPTTDGERRNCPWRKDSDSESFVTNGPLWIYFAGSGEDYKGNVLQLAEKFSNSKADAINLLRKAAGKETQNAKSARKVIDTIYDYTDEDDNLCLQVVRYRPKDFRQRKPDGAGGWKWSVKGVRKPLYNLQEVLKARSVLVVEGEKDVETLRKLGIVATTNVGGATKWMDDYSETLRGKRIVILPDNDAKGQEHARMLSNRLLGLVADLRIVNLPNLPDKGDVTDWVAAGHTAENLLTLIKTANPVSGLFTEPKVKPPDKETDKAKSAPRLNSLTAQALCKKEFPPIKWMVEDLIPEGLIVFFGKEKIGKSFAVLMLGIEIARGGTAFNSIPVEKRGVLYLALEDPQRRLRDRIMFYVDNKMEDIPENLHLVTCTPDIKTIKTGVIEQIEQQLDEHPDIQLVIVDTLQKILGGGSRSKDAYQNSYDIISILHTFAIKRDLCIIVVHHEKKGDGGDAFEKISGSRGLNAVSDAQIRLEKPRFQNEDAILSITGRDVEEKQLSMRWDPEALQWTLSGDATEVCKSREREQIRDVIIELGGEATPSVIQGALAERGIKKTPSSIGYLLARMTNDGEINKLSRGKYFAHSQPSQAHLDIVKTVDVPEPMSVAAEDENPFGDDTRTTTTLLPFDDDTCDMDGVDGLAGLDNTSSFPGLFEE